MATYSAKEEDQVTDETTLSELVVKFNTSIGLTDNNQDKASVKAHDVIHAIFNIDNPSARSEEKVAIIQAILKEDLDVSKKRYDHTQGNDKVTPQAIFNKTVPELHKDFLPYAASTAGKKFKPYKKGSAMPGNEINKWYLKGQIFKTLFEEKHDMAYGEMPIDDLMELKAKPMIKTANQATEMADRLTQKYSIDNSIGQRGFQR